MLQARYWGHYGKTDSNTDVFLKTYNHILPDKSLNPNSDFA